MLAPSGWNTSSDSELQSSHISICWRGGKKKRLIFYSVLELPNEERQKKTYFMLVLSRRVKIYITCGFVFCILLVKVLKETHWYLNNTYGKVSVKTAASYSIQQIRSLFASWMCRFHGFRGIWCGCFQLLLLMWSSKMLEYELESKLNNEWFYTSADV